MAGLNSPMWMFLGPLLLALIIIILINFLEHRVVVPTINRARIKRLTRGCLGNQPDAACSPRVGVIVVCNGHLTSTARQIAALFCSAANPTRLRVIVVRYGDTQREVGSGPTNIIDKVAADQRVQGIDEVLNVRDRIQVLPPPPAIEGALLGNLVALGQGLSTLRASAPADAVEFVAFFGPTMAPTRDWDTQGVTALRDLMATQHDRVILSYGNANTSGARAKPHPTFPVLTFYGQTPMLTWQPFRKSPPVAHPTKLVSSDFLMVPAGVFPEEFVVVLQRMACPPRCADIVVSNILYNLQFRAFVPPGAIAEAQCSNNCSTYIARLKHDARSQAMNGATTKHVLESLQAPTSQSFVKEFLGLNMETRRVRKDALMGTLPPHTMFDSAMLARDVEFKYSSQSDADRVWEQLRKRVDTAATFD